MTDAPQSQPIKRSRMSGEERRKLILQSAKRVFARSTYAEASTGELARESGVTEPMLYKHFGSKKGLFLAILREFSPQFLALYQKRLAEREEKDLLDALEHVVLDYRETINVDPETQRVLFQSVLESSDPEIGQCLRTNNLRVYQMIHDLVERAQAAGYIDKALNLDAVAWGYMSMILANQYALMLNLSQATPLQEEMSQVWLRGLRAQPD
jgi:AcrR family transcriptional regulator